MVFSASLSISSLRGSQIRNIQSFGSYRLDASMGVFPQARHFSFQSNWGLGCVAKCLHIQRQDEFGLFKGVNGCRNSTLQILKYEIPLLVFTVLHPLPANCN